MTRKRWIYTDKGEAIEVTADFEPEIVAPMVVGDLPGYLSQTGAWVEGRAQRREDLKRSGCRPWEGLEQEKKEAARRQSYIDAKADAALERSAGEVYAQFRVTHRI